MFAPLADRLLAYLADWDTAAFLLLNGLHSPLVDTVMRQVSSPWVLVPIHLLVLVVLLRRRSWRTRGTLLAVLLLVVAIDLAGAHLIKDLAQRPRPSQEESLAGVIHLLGGRRSGTYGFASTHTAYAFALATYAWLVLRRSRLTLLVFAWAALVGYSRIYIGLHYPGDVLAGAFWGATAAAAVCWAAVRLGRRSLAGPVSAAPRSQPAGPNAAALPAA
jgi:undecaprenyl-diphosphatase